MGKKLIGIAVVAIMMLGIFGLTACNNDTLDAYKDAGKTAIQTYAYTKGQDNYCSDNWTAICNAVTMGKAAVDAAENKDKVDAAVATAKAEINEVRKEGTGMFYTLQEAYDKALLTVDDLESIAYYRSTEYPESLSAEVKQVIKETKADIIRTRASNPIIEAQASDISIIGYYGTYNDCIAIVLNDSFTDYPDVMREETIAGVTFDYSGARISIWKA